MGLSQPNDIPYGIVQERTFINRVYGWMTGGLFLTAFVALLVAEYKPAAIFNSTTMLILILAQLGLVLVISAAIHKISAGVASFLFLLYAALLGMTLSPILLVYAHSTVANAFFVTAGTFGAMSVYGYTTKRDLTSFGSLAVMALLGLIIASIVNWFLKSEMMDFIISCVGVLIFVALTAYDTQKIKQIHESGAAEGETGRKIAILGALALYLDFINLFLFILKLMGRRRD